MTIETFIGSVVRVHWRVIHIAHDHLLIITRVDEIAMFDTMVQAMRAAAIPSVTK
jgi:hypothetical protein